MSPQKRLLNINLLAHILFTPFCLMFSSSHMLTRLLRTLTTFDTDSLLTLTPTSCLQEGFAWRPSLLACRLAALAGRIRFVDARKHSAHRCCHQFAYRVNKVKWWRESIVWLALDPRPKSLISCRRLLFGSPLGPYKISCSKWVESGLNWPSK